MKTINADNAIVWLVALFVTALWIAAIAEAWPRGKHERWACLMYALLVILATWPLATNPARSVYSPTDHISTDMYASMWNHFWWPATALRNGMDPRVCPLLCAPYSEFVMFQFTAAPLWPLIAIGSFDLGPYPPPPPVFGPGDSTADIEDKDPPRGYLAENYWHGFEVDCFIRCEICRRVFDPTLSMEGNRAEHLCDDCLAKMGPDSVIPGLATATTFQGIVSVSAVYWRNRRDLLAVRVP